MGSVFHAGDYTTVVTSCTIFPIPAIKEEFGWWNLHMVVKVIGGQICPKAVGYQN